MKENSILTDMLVLIGALPISKPAQIRQQQKRMGYPVCYLRHFSKTDREKMKQDTKKLLELFQ